MDPYIIDNMPDDSGEVADLTAPDIVLQSGDIFITLHHDGIQYVISVATDPTSVVPVAAFDPTVELNVATSLFIAMNQSTPIHMSGSRGGNA